jgi:hypothetical protein
MRARNLKPGFFKNEQLAVCDPLARILFQGLWCMADRLGRLEDRPLRVKMEILPYDNCDVNVLLNQLQEELLIVRYEVEGKRYILIPSFVKHQNPHVNEAKSTIPAPCGSSAIPVQAPCDSDSNPAESLLLNPESLFTENPIPETPDKSGAAYSEDFETFWTEYPRHSNTSKKDTFNKWEALLKLPKDEQPTPEQLIQSARNYRAYCKRNNTEDQFIKQATTFLSKKGRHFEAYLADCDAAAVSGDNPSPAPDYRNTMHPADLRILEEIERLEAEQDAQLRGGN